MKKLLILIALMTSLSVSAIAGCSAGGERTHDKPDAVQQRTNDDDIDDDVREPNIIPREPHFPPEPRRDNDNMPVPLPKPEIPR